MPRIKNIFDVHGETFEEAFERFIAHKKSLGLTGKTLKTYQAHMGVCSKYLDVTIPIEDTSSRLIEELVQNLADNAKSRNSVRSYTATLQSFLSWANEEGLCNAKIRLFKGEESVPETYSRDELSRLLKAPNFKQCDFSEYRSWVIANLLINNGPRAATVRSIKNKDVYLDDSVIFLQHMKAKRTISMPLCPDLVSILRRYMLIRKGKPDDYLFCEIDGSQMSENCLRMSMERFHRKRGVQRTGIHKYRHTFARLYLTECDGNAFKLQKLLGHSTLDMTKHYVKMFDDDLIKDFDRNSPLEKLKRKKIKND